MLASDCKNFVLYELQRCNGASTSKQNEKEHAHKRSQDGQREERSLICTTLHQTKYFGDRAYAATLKVFSDSLILHSFAMWWLLVTGLRCPEQQNSHQTHYGYNACNADNAQVQDSNETCACNQHYKTKSKRIGMFGFFGRRITSSGTAFHANVAAGPNHQQR